MNDAGRIGFVIKGNYSATETYDFLDVVYYNGSSYVAKKLTTGNTPQASDDYWQVMANANSADISDETPIFTESTTRTNINSGEKISTLFGKIKKWFTDLKAVAFSGSYNDLSNKPTSLPADGGTAETISSTLPISKGGTGKTTGADAANALINSLATGDSTPTDADYYVSQYVNGGTTTITYHRRPMSALWSYIKSKLATVATSGSYSDLSNKPTIPAAVAVKGNAESSYRTGNVNLTPANIGAVSTTGDTANNTVAFTSADSTTATAWTDVAALATGEKHSSILNKVSTMFKNIRFLYKMLGTTDISAIGDGSVTGALSTLNSNLENMPLHMKQIFKANNNDGTTVYDVDMSDYVKDWRIVPVLVILSRIDATIMYFACCPQNTDMSLRKIIEVGDEERLNAIKIASIDFTYSDKNLSINFSESVKIYRAVNVFALG